MQFYSETRASAIVEKIHKTLVVLHDYISLTETIKLMASKTFVRF